MDTYLCVKINNIPIFETLKFIGSYYLISVHLQKQLYVFIDIDSTPSFFQNILNQYSSTIIFLSSEEEFNKKYEETTVKLDMLIPLVNRQLRPPKISLTQFLTVYRPQQQETPLTNIGVICSFDIELIDFSVISKCIPNYTKNMDTYKKQVIDQLIISTFDFKIIKTKKKVAIYLQREYDNPLLNKYFTTSDYKQQLNDYLKYYVYNGYTVLFFSHLTDCNDIAEIKNKFGFNFQLQNIIYCDEQHMNPLQFFFQALQCDGNVFLYDNCVFCEFIKCATTTDVDISPQNLVLTNTVYYKFADMCLKYNNTFSSKSPHLTTVREIRNGSSSFENKEAIFVSFSFFPHTEFILKNAIGCMKNWKHTVLCSFENIEFIMDKVNQIHLITGPIIEIVSLDTEEQITQYIEKQSQTRDAVFFYDEKTFIIRNPTEISPLRTEIYIANKLGLYCCHCRKEDTNNDSEEVLESPSLFSSIYDKNKVACYYLWENNSFQVLEETIIKRCIEPYNPTFDTEQFCYSLKMRSDEIRHILFTRNIPTDFEKFTFDGLFYQQANVFDNSMAGLSPEQYYQKKGIMETQIINPSQLLFYFSGHFNDEEGENAIKPYFYKNGENNTIYCHYINKVYELSSFCREVVRPQMTFSFFMNRYQVEYENPSLNGGGENNSTPLRMVIYMYITNFRIAFQLVQKLVARKLTGVSVVFSYHKKNKTIIQTKEYKDPLLSWCADKCGCVLLGVDNHWTDTIPFLISYSFLLKRNIRSEYILKIHAMGHPDDKMDIYTSIFGTGGRNISSMEKIMNFLDTNKTIDICAYSGDVYARDPFCVNVCDGECVNTNHSNYFFVAGGVFMGRSKMVEEILDKYGNKTNVIVSACLCVQEYDNLLFTSSSPVHGLERLIGGYYSHNNNKGIFKLNKPENKKKCIVYACCVRSDIYRQIILYTIEIIFKALNVEVYVICSVEEIQISFPSYGWLRVLYVKNDGYDIKKYLLGLYELYLKYDYYVLLNDSISFMKPVKPFVDILDVVGYDMIGMVDSDEIKRHYQSYFLVLNNKTVYELLNDFYYLTKTPKIDKTSLILNVEVGFTNRMINKYDTTSFYRYAYFGRQNEYKSMNPTIVTRFHDFFVETGFPLFKHRLVIYTIPSMSQMLFLGKRKGYIKSAVKKTLRDTGNMDLILLLEKNMTDLYEIP